MNRQLHLNTSNLDGINRRYSFIETPLEMQPPGQRHHDQQFDQQLPAPSLPNTDSIQQAEPEYVHDNAPTGTINEKARHLHQDPNTFPYTGAPPVEHHPANYAPYAEDTIQPSQQIEVAAPHYSYVVPPGSPGPLPIKTNPSYSEHPPNPQNLAIEPDTNPLQSPVLPSFPPPAARSAPQLGASDDITAYHQPGQIAHPNQVIKGGTWSHSLCDCSNILTCCLGLICPCILYGKTQYRLSMKSRKEDPTNLLGYETCNGSCTAMALLCGCQWLLATIQHARVRKAYGIRGDIGSDCVRATCCTCCTLIQDESEIRKREEERGRAAIATGAALVSPYTAPAQMSYGPPK